MFFTKNVHFLVANTVTADHNYQGLVFATDQYDCVLTMKVAGKKCAARAAAKVKKILVFEGFTLKKRKKTATL